jgi:FkbM family methyltransferase
VILAGSQSGVLAQPDRMDYVACMSALDKSIPIHQSTVPARKWAVVSNRLRQLRKLIRLLPSRGFRRGLRYGVAASVEHHALMKGIRLATLLDVGANVGQFSLLIRTMHPDVRIYAFEPLSRAANRFASLFAGDARTTLHRCAIGAESVVSTMMYVSDDDDSSSLLPVTDAQVHFAAGAKTVGAEQVEVRRLDEIVSAADVVRPALLKLDVQGYELPALQGCGPLLDVMDFVYVEVSFMPLYAGQALVDEVVQFLFTHNFSLTAVNNPVFDDAGRCMQADFLLSRRSHA